jgi:predicted transcriptional regulator
MGSTARFHSDGQAGETKLPAELERLFPRMREIASIIYERGGATTKEIQENIEDPLSVCGIRTLLNRMHDRGLVKRRRSGRHAEHLYLPNVLTDEVRARALERLLDDTFNGSAAIALEEVLRLARDQRGRR